VWSIVFVALGASPQTPGIFSGMARVFKGFEDGVVELSDETEASSAGTQLAEGSSDRGCVKDASGGFWGQLISGSLFFSSGPLFEGGFIQTDVGNGGG
jgi:hypothetical protein